MGELASALDSLAADDLHSMFGPQLLDRLGMLLQVQNRIAAEITRTVRECEVTDAAESDGLKSTASWLRGHGHLSSRAAAEVVHAGRALEHLPAVAAAFTEGAVTAAQIGVIATVATPQRLAEAAAADVDLAEIDRALATVAREQSHEQLAAVVRYYREALDPDGDEPDPTEGRRLSFPARFGGGVGIIGELDAVGGEKVRAALEAILQAGRCKGDRRTRSQQLADALVQLADNALASGDLPILRTVKPHVVVTIPAADLTDAAPDAGPGVTAFDQIVSARTARWIACDSTVTRIVLDPDGLPLDVGRDKRVVPPHIRRAVEERDKTCVFAGCEAPKYWCDVHHLLEWLLGGETSVQNSALVCERHHTKLHHGFRVERDPGGRWRTYRPDGSEIVVGRLAPV